MGLSCILELYLTRPGPFVSIPQKVSSGSGLGQSNDCKSSLLPLSKSRQLPQHYNPQQSSSFTAFWVGYSNLPELSLKCFLPMDHRGASYSEFFFKQRFIVLRLPFSTMWARCAILKIAGKKLCIWSLTKDRIRMDVLFPQGYF